jgi:hypothetical protein
MLYHKGFVSRLGKSMDGPFSDFRRHQSSEIPEYFRIEQNVGLIHCG